MWKHGNVEPPSEHPQWVLSEFNKTFLGSAASFTILKPFADVRMCLSRLYDLALLKWRHVTGCHILHVSKACKIIFNSGSWRRKAREVHSVGGKNIVAVALSFIFNDSGGEQQPQVFSLTSDGSG